MVGTDVLLSLARGVQYHLPLWDSALGKGWEEGGGCFRFKSWLYMIFGVKHFWVHSIYYFMLLVQGVRLDWLVFHMISFLLMHILQGCILTFDERQPSMEESLWWKTTFDGRWTLMEDDLWWRMTFDRRRPLMETTFYGRRPLMEDDLWWKTPFDRRKFSRKSFFLLEIPQGEM